jgi:hypothetical protein
MAQFPDQTFSAFFGHLLVVKSGKTKEAKEQYQIVSWQKQNECPISNNFETFWGSNFKNRTS